MRSFFRRRKRKVIRFVTDGTMVYELLAVQVARNSGIMAAPLRSYVLLPLSNDAQYTEPITVNETTFLKMRPVEPTVEHDVDDIHRDLERWLTMRPAWMD